MTYEEAFELLVRLVKGFEGCYLHAYPDPASPLGRELQKRRLWYKVLAGKAEIPGELAELSGGPWTIGYGETLGVKPGMVWTQEYADLRLRHRLAQFLGAVYRACPALHLLEPERAIACCSLAYNIGVGAFKASSVSRNTMRQQFAAAARSFLLWNKAGGKILPGLDARRKLESLVYQLLYGARS